MPADQGRLQGRVRTLFVSDVHLGSPYAQCEPFLEFLRGIEAERLYIVGDFLDGWRLQASWRWQPACTAILRRLAEMADAGTELFYLSGNHDEFLREHHLFSEILRRFEFVTMGDEFLHLTVDGRRFLVTHGDRFDYVETSAKWLSKGSGLFYDALLSGSWHLSRLIGRTNLSPYRFCAMTKDRVKRMIRFIQRYERCLIEHARSRECDGVICGHVHTPSIVHRDGMTYCNTGDWVENCTALVEDDDGTLSLTCFYEAGRQFPSPEHVAPPAHESATRRAAAARGALA